MRRGPLALLVAVAACPNLQGAPCNGNLDCPSSPQQHCVAIDGGLGGRCVSGQPVKGDYYYDAGPDAGFDAGPLCPSAPLAGKITLNGGGFMPDKLVWVDVWDHPPNLVGPDGGRPFELPQTQLQANGDGTFSVSGLSVAKTYWISGQYDLTNNLDAGDLFDDALSPPLPVFTAFPPACDLPVDVSTLALCQVTSGHSPLAGTGAFVLNVTVAARDANTGAEVSDGLVINAQVPDAGAAENLSLDWEEDPDNIRVGSLFGEPDYDYDAGGPEVWAKVGGLPFDIFTAGQPFNALPGEYAFTVVGVGYPAGTCQVPVNPQAGEPIFSGGLAQDSWTDAGFASTFAATWKSAQDMETAPPGTAVSYYDMLVVGTTHNNVLTVTWVSPPIPQDMNFHSFPLTTDVCTPGTPLCVLAVFSVREVVSQIGADPLVVSHEDSATFLQIPGPPDAG